MSNLICKLLEVKSISPPSMSLQRVYESESSASEPVLFITTPGADPSQELQDFAERIVGKARYHQVRAAASAREMSGISDPPVCSVLSGWCFLLGGRGAKTVNLMHALLFGRTCDNSSSGFWIFIHSASPCPCNSIPPCFQLLP